MAIRLAVGFWEHLDEDTLQFAKQLGVSSAQIDTPILPGDGEWTEASLTALRKRFEAAGFRLEAIENVPITLMDRIILGLPGRDEQLARYCDIIRSVGRAGIPVLGYHFMPNQVWRTSAEAPGRGGARVWAFDEREMAGGNKQPYTYWGAVPERPLSEDEMWDNYAYFVRRVMPVAEEAGVRLALHPDDPPMPVVDGYARLFYKPDSFRRAMAIADSPAWGVNLCLGCCSEMAGGAANVHAMIDEFGPKGRILYVHFRDVIGSVPSFRECFLGEGNYKPAEVLRRLIDTGFDGFLLDDHVPFLPGDSSWGHRSHAHQMGYMQGLLDALT